MAERLSFSEIEQAIEAEESTLSFLIGKRDRLISELSRVDNAVQGLTGEGYQGYEITGRADEAERLKEKAEKLSLELSAIQLDIEEKQGNLSALKAEMETAEPAERLQQRQHEFAAQAKSCREMEQRRLALIGERERSAGSLKAVEAELNAAERKRSNALSLDEVSSASSEEEEAQARKSNIEGLLKNIETALAALDSDMRSTRDGLARIKQQVCEACSDAGVQSIQQNPAFREIKGQIEKLFAAFMLAEPYGGNLSQFLLRVFDSQDGTIEGGCGRLGVLQSEVALELGITE